MTARSLVAPDGGLRDILKHTDGVNVAAFSPDGKTLAVASSDGIIRLRDITSLAVPGAK